MALTSVLSATGEFITVTIPKEIVESLGLQPGRLIHWIPDGKGSYRFIPVELEQEAVLGSATVIMERYAPVFARLGKEDHSGNK